MKSVNSKTIETLYNQLQAAIDRVCIELPRGGDADALLDYRSTSWHGYMEKLLREETKNERQHRRGLYHDRYTVSSYTRAKLLICENVASGAKLASMPPATLFLTIRRTAAEAQTIGYVLRGALSPEWIAIASGLDYTEFVKGADRG